MTAALTIFAAVAIFALLLIIRPLRSALFLVLHTAAGWAGLYIFNFLFSALGMTIGINIVSATCVAVLGLPGLLLLILLKFLYK